MGSDFTTHLEELRRRLIFSLVFFLLASLAAYFLVPGFLDFLIAPLYRTGHTELFFQKPYDAFLIRLKAAALAGLLFSSPVLFSQAWLFVAPGLYEREKKILLPLIAVSILLFLAGSSFAYFWVLPWGLDFLLKFQTEHLKPLLNASAYFSFLTGMIVASGLVFDLPVILVGLVQLGVVRVRTLQRSRKAMVVLILILAAVLTPTPDPVSQVALAVPILILFEVSLLIARRLESSAPR